MKTLSRSDDLLQLVLDAVPSAVFLVDKDIRILRSNKAAVELLGSSPSKILSHLCGEVLHCLHDHTSGGGCGTTTHCIECTIRRCVQKAIKGTATRRAHHELIVVRGSGVKTTSLLLTVTPYHHESETGAILVIENITELAELRSLIPICSSCKKIRNDKRFWEQVEAYLDRHLHLKFTHTVCPDCADKLYPDVFPRKSRPTPHTRD